MYKISKQNLENFKSIPEYEKYGISTDGQIYSYHTRKLLRQDIERFRKNKTYISVGLRKDGILSMSMINYKNI